MKKAAFNLGALTAIQGANALAPLVIFPYALHALGSSPYAELVLSEAISQLILATVTFSFDVNGIGRVVQLRINKDQDGISHLFSTILYIRLLMYAVAALCAVFIYHFVMGGPWLNMALWSLVPLSYILQSTWLFQGLEKNIPAAICAISSRIICVGLMFWLVQGPADEYLVPGLMGGAYLCGALATFAYALWGLGIHLRSVSWRELLRAVNEGKEIFLGNFSVSLYRDCNVLILGLAGVAAPALAAYSVAEKLIKCLQAVARPLNQFFFPRVIRDIHGYKKPNTAVALAIMRQTVPQLGGLLLVTLGLVGMYLVAYHVIPGVVTFPNRPEIIAYVSVMVFAVFFGAANFMLGIVGLNHLGAQRYLFAAILSVGLLSVASCFALAHVIGAYAGVYCFTSAEFLLTVIIIRRYVIGELNLSGRAKKQSDVPSKAREL